MRDAGRTDPLQISLHDEMEPQLDGNKSMGHGLRTASSLTTLYSHVLVLLAELMRLGKDAASARLLLDLVLEYMRGHDWWMQRRQLATHCLRTVDAVLRETNQAPLLVTALARQTVAATHPDAAIALAGCLMLLLPAAPSGGGGDAAAAVAGGTGRLGATYSLAIHMLAGRHAQVKHTASYCNHCA
jgi:hypothetical protein